jgi:hypothetical protein
LAVSVTRVEEETLPDWLLNVEEVCPNGIVTKPGTGNALLLEASETVAPGTGAGALRARVREADPPEKTVDGLMVKLLTVGWVDPGPTIQ